MLDSPQTEPLSPDERARVRRLHVLLAAVKACGACGVTLPIDAFGSYGAAACADCAGEPSIEDWWSAQKKALAG